jgi:threonine dehydrogenase-like Zn-dependent dehydrogenase
VKQAVELVETTGYPFKEFVTHIFELEEAEQALLTTSGEREDETDPIKVAIRP